MPKGTATTHGAVTVVNGIPTGRGAAVGIDLPFTATVEWRNGPGTTTVAIADDPDEDPRLVQHAVREAARVAGVQGHAAVHTKTAIPIARGLKSSSVCANTVVLATLRALGHAADPHVVVAAGIRAARAAGVTHTGALDDAAAALFGGLVVTDNQPDRIVLQAPVGDHAVVLLVPDRKRYTKDAVRALTSAAAACTRAHELAAAGEWLEALSINGLACAAALGEPVGPAAAAFDAGALAAGLTGTGPAVAAICPDHRADDVASAFDRFDGVVLRSRTRDPAAGVTA